MQDKKKRVRWHTSDPKKQKKQSTYDLGGAEPSGGRGEDADRVLTRLGRGELELTLGAQLLAVDPVSRWQFLSMVCEGSKMFL
jgi:hypothetical protein